jgi:hypothetical protein
METQSNFQADVRRILDRVRLQLALLRRRSEPWAVQSRRQLRAQEQALEQEAEQDNEV